MASTIDEMAANLESRTREAEAELARLSFLSQSASGLCSSADYRTALQNIAHDAVLSIADYCYIDIFDNKGTFKRMGIDHIHPEKIPLLKNLRLSPQNVSDSIHIPNMTLSKLMGPLVISQSDQQIINQIGLKSLMIVPIKIRNQNIGTMVFAYSESNRTYQKHDLLIAPDLAEYIALAIENAKLRSGKIGSG